MYNVGDWGKGMDGILVIDKPSKMTSRDVLDRMGGWIPRHTKVGHAGTLDPLATGALVVCIGQATRLIEYVQDMGKTYRVTIILGATRDTEKADGVLIPREHTIPDRSAIDEALPGFLGSIKQTPPAYSAAKVQGKRAYALARKGHDVEIAPRMVRVDRNDVLRYEYPELELEIACGKGTYVRSLGRDLGEQLGCGAHVGTLRRLGVGMFDESMMISNDATRTQALAAIRPMGEAVSELTAVTFDVRQWSVFQMGQGISTSGLVFTRPVNDGDEVAVFVDRAFVAIGRVERGLQLVTPYKVFR